jgi:hypothetical protein
MSDTARTTISMPGKSYADAQKRQRELGYRSFSDYIEALIRSDTSMKPDHVRRHTDTPPPEEPPTGPKRKRK